MQEGSQTVISALGSTDTDQVASRVFHQVPAYMIWRPDPQIKAKDAFQQKWSHLYPFPFPLFCLISKVLNKVRLEQVTMVFITPLQQSSSMVHSSSRKVYRSIVNPLDNITDALMTGIFKTNLPSSKYIFIWDVKQALKHMDSMKTNEGLSD